MACRKWEIITEICDLGKNVPKKVYKEIGNIKNVIDICTYGKHEPKMYWNLFNLEKLSIPELLEIKRVALKVW